MPSSNGLPRHSLTQANVVGIDLGGTKIRAGLLTQSFDLPVKTQVPTQATTFDELVDQIVDVVSDLSLAAGQDIGGEIAATALGIAGSVDDESETIGLAPNLAGLAGQNLLAALRARLGHEVRAINDVNASALGEHHWGAARGKKNFAFISIGTGIGMGLVLDEKLYVGTQGAAGEIGFLPIGSDPFAQNDSDSGPLEQVVSGTGVARTFREITGSERTAQEIFGSVDSDPAAAKVVADFTLNLALAVRSVAAVVAPELIVLGGGIGSQPELAKNVRVLLTQMGDSTSAVVTTEAGDWGPVLGAGFAALSTLQSKGTMEING